MHIFQQYRGLRKELYIIFWGRVVTNMGALIWPMLTMILTDKLGCTPGQAANLLLVVGVIQLPCTLIGGRLADRFDKKMIIVLCDLVTVAGYLLCAFLPMSRLLVLVFCISGVFAQVEWPSYDALVANLSTLEERERAYSLNYLGANLGLVLAPTLGGLLYADHLSLAFLINGMATFSSTVLIFFFIRDISLSRETSRAGTYELEQHGATTKDVFRGAPVLLLFLLFLGLEMAFYSVGFNFLMPLNMEQLFGEAGALLFGTLTSVNALVVIIGTPLLTGLLKRVKDSAKLQLGVLIQVVGYLLFRMGGGRVPIYYCSMVVITVGEVVISLGKQPYITRRVPSTHRGRISSIGVMVGMVGEGVCLWLVGYFADRCPIGQIWVGLILLGSINVLLMFVLRREDRKRFPLLYEVQSGE